jgi:hypothetical protein
MSVSLKSVIYGLAIFAFPIAPFVVFGGAFYILYAVNACITEVKNEGISRSSLRFQITETYCSTLGEDAAISIYGSDEAGGGRTLLFKYGPVSDDLPLPEIDVSDQHIITIAVPIVSDIFFQLGSWNNRPIRYDIGHFGFPSPNNGETR